MKGINDIKKELSLIVNSIADILVVVAELEKNNIKKDCLHTVDNVIYLNNIFTANKSKKGK